MWLRVIETVTVRGAEAWTGGATIPARSFSTTSNTQRPCRATHIIPAVRLEEERRRLRAVKIAPKDLALRVPVVVGPTAEVLHETHPYSMPPDAIGIPGTLFLSPSRRSAPSTPDTTWRPQ